MLMSQVKARELLMCNQEMSTHRSTHQTPRLLHFKFKLDPLKDPQWSRPFVDLAFRPFCGPRISAHAFPTLWRARLKFEQKNFID